MQTVCILDICPWAPTPLNLSITWYIIQPHQLLLIDFYMLLAARVLDNAPVPPAHLKLPELHAQGLNIQCAWGLNNLFMPCSALSECLSGGDHLDRGKVCFLESDLPPPPQRLATLWLVKKWWRNRRRGGGRTDLQNEWSRGILTLRVPRYSFPSSKQSSK